MSIQQLTRFFLFLMVKGKSEPLNTFYWFLEINADVTLQIQFVYWICNNRLFQDPLLVYSSLFVKWWWCLSDAVYLEGETFHKLLPDLIQYLEKGTWLSYLSNPNDVHSLLDGAVLLLSSKAHSCLSAVKSPFSFLWAFSCNCALPFLNL